MNRNARGASNSLKSSTSCARSSQPPGSLSRTRRGPIQIVRVVGEASDTETALAQVAALHPDVVLMDIDMPGENGVIATRRLKSDFPDVTVVMLTVHDATDKLLDAIKAGAQGYLVKNIRSAELLDQLRGLRQGEAAMTRRMAARILEEFQRGQGSIGTQDQAGHDLTSSELEVLELVADRLLQQGDRGAAGYQRAHRQEPPEEHPRQAPFAYAATSC
jgi:DNA-binding NarL/FixJ family response regulator